MLHRSHVSHGFGVNKYSYISTNMSDTLKNKDILKIMVWFGLVVFNVPSTARSFRDGTPIYCPLRRT